MVIDTSAIVAILLNAPERRRFNELIERSERCLLSTPTHVETSLVMESSRGYDRVRDFDLLVASAAMELVPLDAEQAHLARHAFRRYGKGRHPAGLNFGDCFSSALAKATGLPLLFKGSDFSRTDLIPAE
jgi:ribonuclease VapC